MTKLLQKAFEEASKLPGSEQDALGCILLGELASERRWEELLPDRTIYLLGLLSKRWQSTVRGRRRS